MAQIRKVLWTRLALEDLDQAYEYVEQERPSAARGLIQSVGRALEALIHYPLMGRVGRIRDTRELYIVNTPFLLTYRVHKDQIEILAFMHAARRWPEDLS